MLQTDLIYECGKALNPAVDLGQVCNTNRFYKLCVESKVHLFNEIADPSIYSSIYRNI